MTMTGFGMNLFNNSLISKSDALSFGPVWYHPIILSLAKHAKHNHKNQHTPQNPLQQHARASGTHGPFTFLNISHMPSM